MYVEFMIAEEVAERLRVRPATIRLWSRRGRILSKRLARSIVRFNPTETMAALGSESHGRAEQ
jgi:predicted site-specific integrase-resolvase